MGCNSNSDHSCGSAWIGGEIVNPKRDYVIISKNRQVFDTVLLDRNNFFNYQLEGIDAGLYSFRHNEYQMVFIEPGDSIMLRVNTVEFDESLSYTGNGAEKNNLLMNLFLKTEEETEVLPSWYGMSPSAFEIKLDSLNNVKRDLYSNFTLKKKVSTDFDYLVMSIIDYDYFLMKEKYISANARRQVYNENIEIPASFYDFRKKVDFGNEKLRGYYIYYRMLNHCLDNLAFDSYKGKHPYNREAYFHNIRKTSLIDSLITNDSLKNSLLRTSARQYFLNAKNEKNGQKMLSIYKELSTSERDVNEISKLANATILLTPGHTLPNVKLLTTENTVTDLHSSLYKPTVLFFWTHQYNRHYRDIHLRATELKSKNPEYNFIGINLDDHFKKWLKTVNSNEFNKLYEYQFESGDYAERKLVINSVNKAIIVNKKATILNGNANIFSPNIEAELLGYLNK